MASQTRAAGRGHRLFTIQSKDSNLIKWPKSLNSLTLVTLALRLFCDSAARRRKTMRLSRALSDLVAYTKSVRVHDIETQGEQSSRRPSTVFHGSVCDSETMFVAVLFLLWQP